MKGSLRTRALCLSIAALALCCLGGCHEDPTETWVFLHADTDLAPNADRLRFRVRPAGDQEESVRIVDIDRAEARIADLFLVPLGGDASRTWEIEAELLEEDAAVAFLRVQGGYEAGAARVVNARFDASCDASCPPGTTCAAGECVGACFDLLPTSAEGMEPERGPACGPCQLCVDAACVDREESCELTETRVFLNALTELAGEATTLRLTYRAGADVEDTEEMRALDGRGRLAELALRPPMGDAEDQWQVVGELFRDDTLLATLRVQGGYEDGQIRVVNARFDESCAGPCDAGTTCSEGACVGACFALAPLVEDPPIQAPRCGACQRCTGLQCEQAADGTACGACEGDVCGGGRCQPRTEVNQVDAAWIHTCATTNRGAHCWGAGAVNQLALGRGNASDVPARVPVSEAQGLRSVELGAEFTCGLWVRNGPTFGRTCWGWPDAGGFAEDIRGNPEPREFSNEGVGTNSSLAVADFATCLVRNDQTIVCAGQNRVGAIGPNAILGETARNWVDVPGSWDDVFAGSDGFCALRDGEAHCWGNARDPAGPEPQPIAVQDACSAGFASLAVSGSSGCGILRGSGELCCWGDNRGGRLGTEQSDLRVEEAAPVKGRMAFTSVAMEAAGDGVAICAAGRDGALYCWGDNANSILGTGDMRVRTEPTRVLEAGGSGVADVSLGESHACAARDDGRLYCWGLNGTANGIGPRPSAGWLGLGLGTDGTDESARQIVRRPTQVCFPN